MIDSAKDDFSIFVGTFNINGATLFASDAQTWLDNDPNYKAQHADLVILSFQECPTCRINGDIGLSSTKHDFDSQEFYHSHSSKTYNEIESTFLDSIQKCISEEHTLLVDLAIGEVPSSKRNEHKKVQWYGFIRLLVFCREYYYDQLSSEAITLKCPVGTKPSNIDLYSYPTGSSPDKGAVCLILPSLNLIVCNVHLMGTNKPNSESYFDIQRIHQLQKISHKIQTSMLQSGYSNSSFGLIMAGDLNFRCEILSQSKDKEKGGNDFKEVHQKVISGNYSDLVTLFLNHDRLLRYLNDLPQVKKQEIQKGNVRQSDRNILTNSVDLFEVACMGKIYIQNYKLPNPTFSFQIDQQHPRIYAQKRTPSWTDRILISNTLLKKENDAEFRELCVDSKDKNFLSGIGKVLYLGSNEEVNISDHAPVHCFLLFQRHKKSMDEITFW